MPANVICLLFMVLVMAGLPQAVRQPPPPKPDDQTVKLRTDLVVMDAQVVRKKTGDVVSGLTARDFALSEDGVDQQISYFSQDALPLSVLILLDVSGSVWPNTLQLRSGALEVLELLKPEDEIALMIFAGSPRVALNFVKDKKLAAEGIRLVDPGGLLAGTNTNEAIYQAADYMKKAGNPEGRRVIIAISDDISTLKHELPHSELQTVHKILESNTVVSGLFFESIYRHKGPEDLNPAAPRMVLLDAKEGIIQSYVDRTGGLTLQADNGNIKDRFALLIRRLRTRYSIGYVSSNQQQDAKFRKIKLKVTPEAEKREGSVGITTKRGYYAR
jgi:VWFA-related protein